MNELAAIFGAAALYLYLEIWTIRICLRYNAWLVALVLLIDHLLLFVNVTVFPAYLFWKTWFLWTSLRVEPIRGLLWTPKVRLGQPQRRGFGMRLLTLRVLLAGSLVVLALLWLTLLVGLPLELVGLVILVLLLAPAVVGLRWVYLTVRRWFEPPYMPREPAPWEAGPVTR